MDSSEQVVRKRGVPGPAPLTAQREEYARLVARGVSNTEACMVVGVHRRTGTRWRNGRTVPARDGTQRQYPAMTVTPRVVDDRSSRYLCQEERVRIGDLRRAGRTMRAIAVELGRDVSTISRELSRNRDDRQRYRPFAAQQMATARLARPRPRRVEQDSVLAAAVQVKLDVKWSPEQISNTLVEDFPDDPSRRLSTETIYQALYAKGAVLQRDPSACLRSGRRRRRPHRRPGRRRLNTAGGPGARPPISDRPAEAEDRTVAGHWEGDLITGRSNKSAIATLVERVSGALILVHLPGAHTADLTITALTGAFTALPGELCRSLTWDRGTEMADHALLTQATGMLVFFADAHCPWQRGSNENSNGLVRQYFPKGTNLAVHSPQRLAEVQDELNTRPRKRHQWATPAARLAALQSPHE